jgi:hypothetical protein
MLPGGDAKFGFIAKKEKAVKDMTSFFEFQRN